MRCVALIIAVCRCIGISEDVFLRRSSKGKIVLNMELISSRILQMIWSLNMGVDLQ